MIANVLSQGKNSEVDTEQPKYKAPKARFVPVVIGGKLAFKFDPLRGLIEWQDRGEKHLIDLATIRVD